MAAKMTYAQNSVPVTGTVLDSTNAPLIAATVTLLNAEDSVLVLFSLSNKSGEFTFRKVKPGEYILQASYIGYRQLSIPLSVTGAQTDVDLGTLTMEAADVSMGEVTIEGERTPILIKKDTIEYNADAFKTQPNAVVEDLLKKLPGVEVQQDGTIKAQGEKVNKVFVDGKEFFGDDPQIASKNLPANAVDKVQVYDKKSDFTEFTGIDDGQREKTINLALKEDKKKGVFGNVSAGYGDQNRYETKANVNRFNKKMQLSLLGMANNTNQQGFSMNDYIQFMGGIQNLISSTGAGGGGGMRITLNASDLGMPLNNGPGSGFTNTGAGGLNFNYDFTKKTQLSSSYFYNGIQNELDRTVFRRNFLAGGEFNSEENSLQENLNQNHRVNLTLRHEIDSMQNLIIRSNVGFNDARSSLNSQSRVLNEAGMTENSGLRDNLSNGENFKANGSLTYRRRFKKKGRSIVATAGVGQTNDDRTADISSYNYFLPEDTLRSFADSVLQTQSQTNDQLDYNLRLNYTEPVGKGNFIGLNLSHQNYSNELIRNVYDIVPSEVLNRDLSNHYLRGYFYERGGMSFTVNRKKYNLTTSVNLQQSRLRGDILTTGDEINQKFLNVLPAMFFNYNFSTSSNMDINYETGVREPSLEQLQPIVDNSDPLNLYIGNPDLRPEYSHRLGLNYHAFSQFTFTNFFANINATYTQNKITNSRSIDSLFRQTTMPVNVKNDLVIRGRMDFGTPLKFIKSRINLNSGVLYNRGIIFVNNQENILDRTITSVGVSIDNRKKDIFDIAVGVNLDHNMTRYSVSSNLNQIFVNQRYYADLSVNLGKKWRIATSADHAVYAGDAFNDETTITLLRASLSRYVLKNNRGELKFSANDMLNQNLGFRRISELNYIQEEQTLTLARYFLVSFTYNLSKFGAAGESGPGGFRMILKDRRR